MAPAAKRNLGKAPIVDDSDESDCVSYSLLLMFFYEILCLYRSSKNNTKLHNKLNVCIYVIFASDSLYKSWCFNYFDACLMLVKSIFCFMLISQTCILFHMVLFISLCLEANFLFMF